LLTVDTVPSEYVRFGTNFDKVPSWAYNCQYVSSPWNTWGWIPSYGPGEQVKILDLVGMGEVLSPPMNPSRFIGLLPHSGEKPYRTEFLGLPPLPHDSGVSASARRAGALHHNTYSLFTGKISSENFISDAVPSDSGENSLTHVNIDGSVAYQYPDDIWYRAYNSTFTWPTQVPPRSSMRYYRDEDGQLFYTVGSETPSFLFSGGATRNPHNWLHLCAPTRTNTWFTYNQAYFGGVGSRTYDFEVFMRDAYSVHHVTYKHESYEKDFTYYYRRTFSCTVSYSWSVNIPETPYMYGEEISVSDFIKGLVSYTVTPIEYLRIKRSDSSQSYMQLPSEYTLEFECPAYLSHGVPEAGLQPDQLLFSRIDLDGGRYDSPYSYLLLKDWNRRVSQMAPRIFPACYYSGEEASTSLIGQIEANHLENLTQLGEIKDILKMLLDAGRTANNLRKGNVSGVAKTLANASHNPMRAIKNIVDVVTDAELLYSYGVAPTISDAKELSSKAGDTLRLFTRKSVYDYRTFYGRFYFDFEDNIVPPYTGLRLEANTKLVARLSPNSVLSALVPIKAMGLFPSLSNLWDLVSFSFVADWFTGIGDKLDAIDNNFFLLLLDVKYSVSSMKLSWDIPDEILTACSLSANVDDHPRLIYYTRSVMKSAPVLQYTDIDFQPGHGLPSWETVGSLFYKVVHKK